MDAGERRLIREEFYTWALETQDNINRVLSQNLKHGGVLGKNRLRAMEIQNGSFRESNKRK
jgi:hypothetical protein